MTKSNNGKHRLFFYNKNTNKGLWESSADKCETVWGKLIPDS